MMGKMRPNQEFDTAQLVLKTRTSKPTPKGKEKEKEKPTNKPKEVVLDEGYEVLDDVNIASEKDRSTEKEEVESLSTLQQCLLLAMCVNVKNDNPEHGLTTEEMFPYVRKVQANHQNWMVHSSCLLQRTRLEIERLKTKERAVLQV